MTRRLHHCLSCEPDNSGSKFTLRRGFTRHKNRVCAKCRRSGVTARGGVVRVRINVDLRGRGA